MKKLSERIETKIVSIKKEYDQIPAGVMVRKPYENTPLEKFVSPPTPDEIRKYVARKTKENPDSFSLVEFADWVLTRDEWLR
jgi:hypothetical protein